MIINLGAGTMPKKEGVLNIDLREADNIDIVSDVRKLPFDDNSIDGVTSQYLIEHFGRLEIDDLLKEWLRVIKPGGYLEIITVDLEGTMDNWRTIPWENVMDAIYGAQTYELNFHKVGFTEQWFKDYFTGKGYSGECNKFTLREIPRLKIKITKV